MRVIYIKNYKRKTLLFISILSFWILMFLISNVIINRNLVMNITVNDYLSFSYPFNFEVDDILISEFISGNTIQTNSSYKKPITKEYIDFKTFEGKFSFIYPSFFILSQKDFAGSDILYHIDFHSKSNDSHGFIQVWNLPYSLKDFLDKSKENSLQNFKNFNSKTIVVNNLQGYLWEYSVLGNDGIAYRSSEVFLKKDNKMYRISYFVPEDKWNKTQSDIFWRMVNSFKTY